ncbi:MAG: pseudouridylate synthase [Prevotella sp.]|jgi:predicted hotdog family 3-hydroxylacyl-ACP dehydratase
MDFKNIVITRLIPQRPPFVMVDHLLSCDEVDAETEFKLKSDCLFLDGDRLSPSGIIENMAQSCAARIGYLNRVHGKGVKIGLIGEIRNCEIQHLPQVGDMLTTKVHVQEDFFGLVLAEIAVRSGEKVIAVGTMKIATVDAGFNKDK